jgi:hypothetical protein
MNNIKAQAVQVVMSDRIEKLKDKSIVQSNVFTVKKEKAESMLFSVGDFLKRVA